jgi:hypothetical protein
MENRDTVVRREIVKEKRWTFSPFSFSARDPHAGFLPSAKSHRIRNLRRSAASALGLANNEKLCMVLC